jgi:hypothetical protein
MAERRKLTASIIAFKRKKNSEFFFFNNQKKYFSCPKRIKEYIKINYVYIYPEWRNA